MGWILEILIKWLFIREKMTILRFKVNVYGIKGKLTFEKLLPFIVKS